MDMIEIFDDNPDNLTAIVPKVTVNTSFLDTDGFKVTAMVFCAMFAFFGIANNVFLIAMIGYCRELRNLVNVFILQIAIGDLFILVFCIPFSVPVAYFFKTWIWGETICYSQKMGACMGPTITVMALVILSYERYLAVCHPMTFKAWSRSKVTLSVTFVYVTAFCRAIVRPTIGKPFKVKYDNETGQTTYSCSEAKGSLYSKCFQLIGFSLFFIFPIIMLIFFYANIAWTITTEHKRELSRHNANTRQERVKLVRMVVVIVVCFIVCSFMSNSLGLMSVTKIMYVIKKEAWFPVYCLVARILSYSNCVFNPLIFAMMSSKYRKVVGKMFCKRASKAEGSSKSTATPSTGTQSETDCRLTVSFSDSYTYKLSTIAEKPQAIEEEATSAEEGSTDI